MLHLDFSQDDLMPQSGCTWLWRGQAAPSSNVMLTGGFLGWSFLNTGKVPEVTEFCTAIFDCRIIQGVLVMCGWIQEELCFCRLHSDLVWINSPTLLFLTQKHFTTNFYHRIPPGTWLSGGVRNCFVSQQGRLFPLVTFFSLSMPLYGGKGDFITCFCYYQTVE